MLQVLVRVLDDAEEGKVTEEGFQVFSLTWQAVYGALRDRLLLGPLPPPSSTRPDTSGLDEDAPPETPLNTPSPARNPDPSQGDQT